MTNNTMLAQKGLFASERVFEIKDERYLFVKEKGVNHQGRAYQIDLVALCPQSHTKLTIAWPWLFAALCVLLLMYLLLAVMPRIFAVSFSDYALALTLGLSMLAFIFIFMFVSTSYREQVYEANISHFPLVRLLNSKPDRKAFQSFRENLESRIETLSRHVDLNSQQRLAGEVKMLRRLIKYDVLSEKEYEEIKSRLFNKSDTE